MISNSPARLNNLGLELLESIQHEFEPEYYCSSLTGVLCLTLCCQCQLYQLQGIQTVYNKSGLYTQLTPM